MLPAPEHSYLVLLFIVLGETALKPQRQFLELHDDIGVGSIVFEAHGVLHYVLHQEKCLLKVTHGIFQLLLVYKLKGNLAGSLHLTINQLLEELQVSVPDHVATVF